MVKKKSQKGSAKTYLNQNEWIMPRQMNKYHLVNAMVDHNMNTNYNTTNYKTTNNNKNTDTNTNYITN